MKTADTDHYTGDIVQNYFTAYVEEALKNNRVSYYRKNKARLKSILLYDSEDQLDAHAGLHIDLSDTIPATQPLHINSIHTPSLAKELRNLPDKDLDIIHMRIVYGYTYKNIGSILGMKEEAVRVRYFRAIKKIRKNLKGDQK